MDEGELPKTLDLKTRFFIYGQVREHIFWQPLNYPHLHTPEAASIVLQWTLRDGAHVNLPWALLVKDDIIMVKPGQGSIQAIISLISMICHIPDLLIIQCRNNG